MTAVPVSAPAFETLPARRRVYEVFQLKSGNFAVKATIREGKPIFLFGFHSESEARNWLEREMAQQPQ
jgi:hypothetical protein